MSNLEFRIATIGARLAEHGGVMQTEEAVKTSFVLPFLQALGYDVFNPTEVVPEFTADVPGKRGEKVDYAIKRDGEVIILIECKGLGTPLNERHLAQLYRYFSVTNARFAILTNGKEYWFFSDLEAANKMDHKPFFTFDVTDHSASSVSELQKFEKASFDVDNILAQAERLKYVRAIRTWLKNEMEAPSEAFARLVASGVYEGRISSEVRGMIAKGIPAAFREIVRDRLRDRLSSALNDTTVADADDNVAPPSEIVTTEEEIEGYLTVKAILRGAVDSNRVVIRDAKSYCAVLLDDNNRKPIARLHFNRRQKYLGIFDNDAEERVAIDSLDQILDFADRIRATVTKYV